METGVHTGESLKLASCSAWGIDPAPHIGRNLKPTESVFTLPSDTFFEQHKDLPTRIDLGFIDGMHLYEYAWRDFLNMEHHARDTGVIVFDDVLPYTKFMASRTMVPGDWTGDVWKVFYLLMQHRPDLKMRLVDTTPTGTLVVWNLDPTMRDKMAGWQTPAWYGEDEPGDDVLFRVGAVTPEQLLTTLEADLDAIRVRRLSEGAT